MCVVLQETSRFKIFLVVFRNAQHLAISVVSVLQKKSSHKDPFSTRKYHIFHVNRRSTVHTLPSTLFFDSDHNTLHLTLIP